MKKIIVSNNSKKIVAAFLGTCAALVLLYTSMFIVYVPKVFISKDEKSLSFNFFRIATVLLKKSPVPFLLLILISGLAGFLIYRLAMKKRRIDDRGLILAKDQTQGCDKLMDFEEKKRVFDLTPREKPKGVILGQDEKSNLLITVPFDGSKAPENGNILIVGKSGSRKTTSVLLPNIFSCIQSGYSCVCTDPKGEIYSKTVAAAIANGYNIRIINILPEEFTHSDGWDVVKAIRTAVDPEQMAELIVNVFCSNLSNVEKNFWEDANRNLFKAALLCVAVATDYIPVTSTDNSAKGRTLAEVYNLISSEDCEERMKNLIKASSRNRKLLAASFNSWAEHSQKDSIRAGLATKLSILQSENLSRVLSEDEIDFKELDERKTMLYIICSDKDSTYQCVLSLICAMLFYQVTYIADKSPNKCLSRPLYFFFEEFKNIGYIPDLSKKIATLRSRRINMVFCYQNIDQLRDTYSSKGAEHEYQTIIASCALSVCCGSGDSETNKFFSDKTGVMTIEESMTSIQTSTFMPKVLQVNPRGSIRKQSKGRAVMLESEIAKIKADEILIIKSGNNPTLDKKYFYKNHPLYQYQAVDSFGEIIEPSHIDHIPGWAKKEQLKEAAKVTGYKIQFSEKPINVIKFDGLHLVQELNELDEKYSSKLGFFQRAANFIYEPEENSPQICSNKTIDHFIRNDEE